MKPPILTLTGNLLWEKTFAFSRWSPGRTQRATAESFQVGGKGVNVVKMLARLGVPARALCFPGGATGADCVAWMRANKIPFRAFRTIVPTRAGAVVRGGRHGETTFLGCDAAPDAAALRACARFLRSRPAGTALAVCGSFPGWDSPAAVPLRAALGRWLARDGFLAADTYGPPLAWLARHPVALVKVNRMEFDAFFPPHLRRAPVSSRLRQVCRRWPVQAWIVSDGPKPVWLIEKNSLRPVALAPPRVREVSPTGSGDVLLACTLYAWLHRGAPLADALAFALPYAAANAARPDVAEFTMNNLPRLGSKLA
ncbi:MAG TPA: PfkB family carbohydrate kinase [Opitutaceae bacterium]|nr:PfkB family carbohydrate kinase [Opitutaceae bacterium]